jgi:Leucine-rich repeat (LRR) protein
MKQSFFKPGSDKMIHKTNAIVTVSFILLFIYFFSGIVWGTIPPEERAALIALYNSTDGDNWRDNQGWKTPPLHTDGFAMPGTEKDWYGIICDMLHPGDERVRGIRLLFNNLTGNIPPELGNISYLEDLVLTLNQLTGNIPPELGNLSYLDYLDLSSNQLTGSIPPELGNLSSIDSFYLEHNQLTGSIPPELGNLLNIWEFRLDSNQLTGSIPPELGNISIHWLLDLSFNKLTGSIPPELSNLSFLYFIDLSSNQLTGSIPPELQNLSNLHGLYLENNQLTGSIPPELQNLSELSSLFLGNNQLSGNIPKELGYLQSLNYLDLSFNQLSGFIPPNLGYLPRLLALHLSGNQLTGIIPPELGNLPNLYELELSFNQLSGFIPPNLGYLPLLESLHLSGNQLTGSIPLELGNLQRLISLYLSFNQLSGTIPLELGNLPKLKQLKLDSNQLEGPIPPEMGNLSNLERLDLSSNQLDGIIPPQIQNLLNLSDNLSDFRWNAIYTDDETMKSFLNSKQLGGDWQSTQTTEPKGVSARAVSGTSIEVSWIPISYIQDEGGYRVYYSRTPGGPYTLFGSTGTKYNSKMEFTGVEPFTDYYFVVQTRTESHQYNPNILDSRFSEEVSALTRGSDKIISGRIATKEGEGVAGISMVFSPAASTGITDASGYYRYAVKPGWSGTVMPLRTGYNFEPVVIKFENVTAHQRGIDFKTMPITTTISGFVLSGGEGIENVTLTFVSYSGETETAITDANGYYINDLPFGWTGRVTPSKGDFIFYPTHRDYGEPGVTGNMAHQDFKLSVSITLNVLRQKNRSVIIREEYGEIEFNANITGISLYTVQKFIIYRKESNGSYGPIKEFHVQYPYQFTYIDKYLENGKTYTYIGRALDAAGNAIGESKEKSI